ncbi:MAG TPA: hypothetical protein VFV05_09670 [Methylomirabilota bacterium]|nr:hypothetical protein [Methylomirabilota bacterium]
MGKRWQRKWEWDARTEGWSPISRLRAAYHDEGTAPSLTQYGWVREG